jgi:DNA-binding MarR family transcriptional regulator
MPDNGLYPIANEIVIYASLLLKYFNQALEERLRQQGANLTGLQYGVLRMLQFEVLTLSVLSQRMGLDPSSLMRIIDALERKGFVARGNDPHDRRRNPIHITEEGSTLLETVPSIAGLDPAFKALVTLGDDQTEQLRDLLQMIVVQFPEGRLVSGMLSAVPGGQIPPTGPAAPMNKT